MAEIRAVYTKETRESEGEKDKPPFAQCNCAICREARGGYDLNPLQRLLIGMFFLMFVAVLGILAHVVK